MAIPFLNNITLNNNEIQNVKLHNTGSIPSPASGHIYFDTDDNIAKYYDGSVWIDIVANTNDFLTGLSFDDTNGILTATVSNQTDVTVDLDGRYALADDIPTNIVETVITTDGTYINLTPDAAVDGDVTVTADLSATDGTAAANERYLTKNNKWAEIATIPGTYDFDVSDGTANNTTTIASGGTVTFLATPNETTVEESNGTITIGLPDNVTIAGNLTVTGTTTTNNVETVSTSNGVIFEGNAADANELTLLAGTLTADRTVTLPDATGTVALTSQLHDAVTLAGSYDYITLSGQQLTLNQIDYATDITNLPAIPVPNNATITVNAGGGLTGGGDFTTDQAVNEIITVSHADTSSQGSVDNSGRTYIQDITLDTYGHITGITSATETVTNTDTNTQLATKKADIDVSNSTFISNKRATINHSLDSENVVVQMYDKVTGQVVHADVEHTSNGSTISKNHVRIEFGVVPANDIRVIMIDAKDSAASVSPSYS